MSYLVNIKTGKPEYKSISELSYKIENYFEDNNGNYYCYPDFINDFDICTDCGNLIIKADGEYYTTASDDIICKECYENNYFTCEDCGKIYYSDDAVKVHCHNNYDIWVCDNCADNNYYKCIECGEYYEKTNGYTDINEDFLCDDCHDRYGYTICDNCECFTQDGQWIDGYCYCATCADEHKKTEKIKQYGYIPEDLPFKGKHSEMHYAFELEVEANEDTAEEFLNNFYDDNEVYLTYDSSVNGYEITTCPMTYDYLINDFRKRLEAGLNYLKTTGATGHNAGGLHIHIDTDKITDIERAIIAHILYIDEKRNPEQFNKLLTITQRSKAKLECWADNDPIQFDNNVFKHFYKCSYCGTHSTALNRQHSATLECRIFNSNLRIERILKNIQFVKALIEYANDITYKLTEKEIKTNLNNINIDSLFAYIIENQTNYPDLFNFMIEKALINKQLPLETEVSLCA